MPTIIANTQIPNGECSTCVFSWPAGRPRYHLSRSAPYYNAPCNTCRKPVLSNYLRRPGPTLWTRCAKKCGPAILGMRHRPWHPTLCERCGAPMDTAPPPRVRPARRTTPFRLPGFRALARRHLARLVDVFPPARELLKRSVT